MYVLGIKVAISLLNLASINQKIKTCQTFFKIEDDGVRIFEFLQLCIFNLIYVFLIEVTLFPSLVNIDHIVVKQNVCNDRSNIEELAAVFRNSGWRRPPS